MKNITILGSTGSIGTSTLDVIARNPTEFNVVALTAHKNSELLFQQCVQFRPAYAVLHDAVAAKLLRERLQPIHPTICVLSGADALIEVASLPQVDAVVAAIVGAIGLLPTLAAVRLGKQILLANKEVLVMAGGVFMDEVRKSNAVLLPVDSEHNAIFQCLPADFNSGEQHPTVRKILLTASGGACRHIPLEKLAFVTPEQACQHPNWRMGQKVTIDSATMMNKGLEVIEAYWLFGLPPENIEVLLHPQSMVHSLVEYIDGSLLAHLGSPDMRVPIAHVLAWPNRIENGVQSLDLLAQGQLDFKAMDLQRYPCLGLAYAALRAGGTATAILNAANEIAVQAFLDQQITFTEIFTIVEQVLNKLPCRPADNLAVILEDDQRARELATINVSSISGQTLMV